MEAHLANGEVVHQIESAISRHDDRWHITVESIGVNAYTVWQGINIGTIDPNLETPFALQ